MTALIEALILKKYYRVGGSFRNPKYLRAVDGVTLTINEGETVGLVGESGSGKSTFGKCLLHLEELTSGRIKFLGEDITECSKTHLIRLRKFMQIVFQDPLGSLNPRLTVGKIVAEPLKIHKLTRGNRMVNRVTELFEMVGLKPEHMERYPHQLSGGQQQRVNIARALATEPRFVVLDEPTSALDVSIQAQILHLLKKLQKDLKLTYLFISHDLSVLSTLAQRIAVMYLGQIIERGPVNEVFGYPKHPYTQALISTVPIEDPTIKKERILLKGEVTSAIDPPTNCRLSPRCPFVEERCRAESQFLHPVTPFHEVRCWKWDQIKTAPLHNSAHVAEIAK